MPKKNTAISMNSNALVVMSLAAACIVVSQFGTGLYSNADIVMTAIASFILMCIPILKINKREVLVLASVWGLTAFHAAETFQLYGSKGMRIYNNEHNISLMYDLYFSASIAVAIGTFFLVLIYAFIRKK